MIVLVVYWAIRYWYVTVPVVIVLVGAVVIAVRAQARREEEAVRQWLSQPPPAMDVPGRFTDKWFRDHIPTMHPGQVPALMSELHARGWTDARIAERIDPYLAANPYYRTSGQDAVEDEVVNAVSGPSLERTEPRERTAAREEAPPSASTTSERSRVGFRPLTLKEARQGETLVLQTEDGPRVAVRIGTVLDPVKPRHSYDEPGEHVHLVAVEFELTNQGPGVFSYDPVYNSKLLGAGGAEYSYYVLAANSAGTALPVATFTDAVRLAPKASRKAYVCYAVNDGDRPQRVEVLFGLDLEADIGQWSIDSVSQALPSLPEPDEETRPPVTDEDGMTSRWLADLRQPEVEKRKVAASALAHAPTEAVRGALNTATKDPDFSVRFSATEGLVKLGGDDLLSVLRGALQDSVSYLRQRGVRWLADIPGDEATEAIRSALNDTDRSVRGEAEGALDRRDGYADPVGGYEVPYEEAEAFVTRAPEGSVPLSPEWSTTVTGEEDHQDVLRELAPAGTDPVRWETATLGFCPIAKGKYAGEQAIEVRLGGERVGQLTRAMSERYEKLVSDALDAGKTPICKASLFSTRDKGVQVQIMMPERNR
jgi:hypothetical protein